LIGQDWKIPVLFFVVGGKSGSMEKLKIMQKLS
jgi:hypothetical protein